MHIVRLLVCPYCKGSQLYRTHAVVQEPVSSGASKETVLQYVDQMLLELEVHVYVCVYVCVGLVGDS